MVWSRLVMGIIIITFHGGFFKGAVHALYLSLPLGNNLGIDIADP
jgi:hypothetical protein